MQQDLPTRADVAAAQERIRNWVRRTPVCEIEGICRGANVILKLDHMQYSGSFKARGAFNAMLARPVPKAGVVTASGGNHGAAVAFAAQRLSHRATIFVPTTAPSAKVERLRGYGAELVQVGAVYAEAQQAAASYATRTGARMLHAYDDALVVAGQGTAALEFEEQVGGALDTIVIAVGGGGLIGGTIAALVGMGTRVVAVESTRTPTLARALEAGRPVDVEVGGLAADALGASRIGEHGFALARAHVSAMVLVEDDEIRRAQFALWEDYRLVTEPAGAAALAALLSGHYRPASGERVGVLLCGGNVDPASLRP